MNNNIKTYIVKHHSEEKYANNVKMAEQELAKLDNADNRHGLAAAKLHQRVRNHVVYTLSNCDEKDIMDVEYALMLKLVTYCEEHTAEELDKADHLDVFGK